MEMQNDFTKIERYAKGELEGNDLATFEQEIQDDEKLANEASFYKDMAQVIDLKEQLKGIDANLEAEHFFDDIKVQHYKYQDSNCLEKHLRL